MSLAMVLKMFSDCSLFFAILGMMDSNFSVPLLIPAVLYGVAAGLATFFEEKNWPVLRRLCALLPWLCLFFEENALQMILLAVPAAYCSLMILFGKLELEYYTYRRFFLQSLVLVGGAYLMVNALNFLAQNIKDSVMSLVLNPNAILRYGLVHLLCGIVLQRQLRLGVGEHAEGGRRQMVTMLATTATIIVCTVAAEPLLRQVVGTLVDAVLTVLAAPFVLLVKEVGRLYDRFPKTKETLDKLVENLPEPTEPTTIEMETNGHKPVQPISNLNVLPIVLLVVFILVIAVLLFKSFQKRRQTAVLAENVSLAPNLPKKKKTLPLSNRGRVRQLDRDVLREEKKRGMKLKISDTSGDVLEHIHQNTDRPSADDLRQVYLAARYDDRQGIIRSQVEQAKRALKASHKRK